MGLAVRDPGLAKRRVLRAGAICTVSDRLASLATLMTLPAGLSEGDRCTCHGGEIEEPLRSGSRESAYTIEGQKKGGSSSTLLCVDNLDWLPLPCLLDVGMRLVK